MFARCWQPVAPAFQFLAWAVAPACLALYAAASCSSSKHNLSDLPPPGTRPVLLASAARCQRRFSEGSKEMIRQAFREGGGSGNCCCKSCGVSSGLSTSCTPAGWLSLQGQTACPLALHRYALSINGLIKTSTPPASRQVITLGAPGTVPGRWPHAEKGGGWVQHEWLPHSQDQRKRTTWLPRAGPACC